MQPTVESHSNKGELVKRSDVQALELWLGPDTTPRKMRKVFRAACINGVFHIINYCQTWYNAKGIPLPSCGWEGGCQSNWPKVLDYLAEIGVPMACEASEHQPAQTFNHVLAWSLGGGDRMLASVLKYAGEQKYDPSVGFTVNECDAILVRFTRLYLHDKQTWAQVKEGRPEVFQWLHENKVKLFVGEPDTYHPFFKELVEEGF